MHTGTMMGYVMALAVGIYMVYLIFEAAKRNEYADIAFWGPLIGLLSVIILPVAFTAHGKSKAKD